MSSPSGCLQRVGLCAVLALALALSACARCPEGTGPGQVFFPASKSCESLESVKARPEYANLPFFAALSASAYSVNATHELEAGVKEYASLKDYCRTGDKEEERYKENEAYRPSWLKSLELKDYPQTPAKFGMDIKGLGYQVLAPDSSKPKRVYIVFRGTDGLGAFGDMFSNGRWFTRMVPGVNDEYDQMLRNLDKLGTVVRERYGEDAAITTLGHSLGGGLAQLTAYGFPWSGQARSVDRVYAFDPSPVTGYYSVDQQLRERNSVGMNIYRVYDKGELLSYLREFMKGLYPVSTDYPAITEVRFNVLTTGDAVKQHNMRDFACKLWEAYGRPEFLEAP